MVCVLACLLCVWLCPIVLDQFLFGTAPEQVPVQPPVNFKINAFIHLFCLFPRSPPPLLGCFSMFIRCFFLCFWVFLRKYVWFSLHVHQGISHFLRKMYIFFLQDRLQFYQVHPVSSQVEDCKFIVWLYHL